VERRVVKGANAWDIDRGMLTRGLIIALLDLTIVSLGSGHWNFLRTLELRIGVRENGPFYVFGQTAMFFYIAHRLAFEVPATWFGLRDFDGLTATYGIVAVALFLLYPACLWYRRVKAAHPQSILKYL
jgi:hypothetical protein